MKDNDGCLGLIVLVCIVCTFVKTCSIDNKVNRIETMMEKSIQRQIENQDKLIHRLDSLERNQAVRLNCK